MKAEPEKARQILRTLLTGRLVFEPDPERGIYTFTGQASYGRLLTGVLQKCVVPPGGSAHLRLALPVRGRVRAA